MLTTRLLPILLIVAIVFTYAAFRSTALRTGPVLTIEGPEAHAVVPQRITIRGTVENVTFLTVNDQRVFPQRDGTFSHVVALPIGYTVLELYASNKRAQELTTTLPLTVVTSNTYANSKKENTEEEVSGAE